MQNQHWALGFFLTALSFLSVCNGQRVPVQTTVEYLPRSTKATRGPFPSYGPLPPNAYLPLPKRPLTGFNGTFYRGYRESTTVRIWTLLSRSAPLHPNSSFFHCYGVHINVTVIACPCSCISKPEGDTGKLVVYGPEDIGMSPIKYEYFNDDVRDDHFYKPKQVEIHPSCDASYAVDIAALYMEQPIPDMKVVWLHTAEYPIFRTNLLQVQAAENMDSGVCTALVSKASMHVQIIATNSTFKRVPITDEVKVEFRHWYACARMACPGDDASEKPYQGPTVAGEDRCMNVKTGSKYCITWKGPYPLCQIFPGTPIFCNIDGVDGFMGFIVQRTYQCNPWDRQFAVMQGFDDGVDFFRKYIGVVGARSYESIIPFWVKDKRIMYEHKGITMAGTTTSSVSFGPYEYLQLFGSYQWRSVVNIWHQTYPVKAVHAKVPREEERFEYLCHGTIVATHFILTSCKCLVNYQVPPEGIKGPVEGFVIKFKRTDVREASLLKVMVSSDDDSPRSPKNKARPPDAAMTGANNGIHPRCDSLYAFDYGWIDTHEKMIPPGSLAWYAVFEDADMLKNEIKLLTIADFVEGQCFIIDYRKNNKPDVIPIYFQHWHECFLSVCDTWLVLAGKPSNRCYNNLPGSRYCFITREASRVGCNMTDGAPIFCRAFGLTAYVGHYSRSWSSCRTGLQSYGVVMALNEAISEFKNITALEYELHRWIHLGLRGNVHLSGTIPMTLSTALLQFYLILAIGGFFL